ncbi:hypothetical protein MW887_011520 [Aspergillus wentii]|nr:hypothetical protein MW887_011520 [Aspergillus wentii]
MAPPEDTDLSAGPASENIVPPSYGEACTINVLITGECQQGKSTLIRHLARYADLPNFSIGIGSGNKAYTMEVGNYDMPVTLRRYQLVDFNNQPIAPREYSDLAELNDFEAKAVEVREPNAPKFMFRFIDTPGLDDTAGEDFSIMNRILGRACDLKYINALIYVRSVDQPFGSSFKKFFRYIQRSMPNLCNGLIVVHSFFTVDRVEEFLNENKLLEEIRRKGFEASTQLELQHFFMDNSPDPTAPFAVMQSLNETYRLLLHISSQIPLPVKNINLIKTDAMRSVDIHIINALKNLARRLEKEWKLGQNTAETLKANAMSAQREISRLRNRVHMKKEKIAELKTGDEILLGTKSCVERYSFVGDLLFQGNLNVGSRPLEYDSDYIISSVQKSCSGGSKWLDEDLRGTSWRGKITANLFRDIDGTATFYTTSELKHKKEIETLEAAVLELQDMLATQEENLARNTDAGSSDSRLAQLGDNVAKVEELTEIIERDSFNVALWPLLRGFYTQHTVPTFENIKEFVQVYDMNISKLL